jgi:ParB/RepB/Spo0J family partition protein
VTELSAEEADDVLDGLDLSSVTGQRRAIPGPKAMSREFLDVPVESVIVLPDRVRKEIDSRVEGEGLRDIQNSMDALGLVHPISLTKDFVLRAGQRRFMCAKRLGWSTVPAQLINDASPETLARIEFEENFTRKNFNTVEAIQGKARIAEKLMATGLSQKQVAAEMKMSESYLSDTIKNAKFIESNPEAVKYCETGDQVKKTREKIQRINDQKAREYWRGELGGDKPAHEILTKDFNEWALAYKGEPFNVWFVDFPYGIGQDKFNQSSRTDVRYSDTKEVNERLVKTLRYCWDSGMMGERGAMLYWDPGATDRLYEDRHMFLGWGMKVLERPVLWIKNVGIIPVPNVTPRQCYEPALLCTWGGYEIDSKRDWFLADPPNARISQSEKSEAAVEHFLQMLRVGPGTRLIDPTCSSGVAIRVAKRLGAEYALGLEVDENSALLARAALENAR